MKSRKRNKAKHEAVVEKWKIYIFAQETQTFQQTHVRNV